MPQGDDPLLIVLRDALVAEIETVDRDAEGYFFNYERVRTNSGAWIAAGESPLRPIPHLRWDGQLGGPEDERHGSEKGYRRFVRWDAFILSFAFADPEGDHEAMAWRIEADFQHRLIEPVRRRLGATSSLRGWPLLTWVGVEWFPAFSADGMAMLGGIMEVTLGLRHQHQSGDMSLGG